MFTSSDLLETVVSFNEYMCYNTSTANCILVQLFRVSCKIVRNTVEHLGLICNLDLRITVKNVTPL